MADHDALEQPVVETIPSVAGGVSAIASGSAPFIYFDAASTFAFNHGIASITLEAVRYVAIAAGAAPDRVMVAHLRMSPAALGSLKQAIEAIELLAVPAPEGSKN